MKLVIVGAGPRGLSALERIVAHGRQRTKEHIQITLLDSHGLGGRIWREEQSSLLLINSIASHVTLFTDQSLSTDGPVAEGPNLYEWAKRVAPDFISQTIVVNQQGFLREAQRLGPNDCCSRAFYGLYQKWFFQQIKQHLPSHIKVTFLKEMALALNIGDGKFVLNTVNQKIPADKVILALGHHETELSKSEQRYISYAGDHQLYYSPPKNVADVDLDMIQPQEPLLLRGLGLAFFDYVALLTSGRGGTFKRQAGRLIYQPSGNEPQIIAGSNRGFPYHPRGKNQMTYGKQYQPHFLTEEKLAAWKRNGKASAKEFYSLLQKEMELVYYALLVQKKFLNPNKTVFEKDFVLSMGDVAVLKRYDITPEEYWDWQFFEHPESYQAPEQPFSIFIRDYLKWDCKEAKLGNRQGPVAAAFDCLKDMRNQVRFMLDNNLFTSDEIVHFHWRWFAPLNRFLTIGPPFCRTEELMALLDAGIVKLLGPKLQVEMSDGHFLAYSQAFPEEKYAAKVFMEARLQPTDVQKTKNPLLRQLLEDGLIQRHKLKLANGEAYYTGAVAVDNLTNQVLDSHGNPVAGFFCCGIPTEGLHWMTASTSRPGTNPWNLREADRIAGLIISD